MTRWLIGSLVVLALVGAPITFDATLAGTGLTPRPDAYVLIGAQAAVCAGHTAVPDTVMLFYENRAGWRRVEFHMMTPPQRVGIVTYAPGVTGAFQSAEILFPNGKVVRFSDEATLTQTYPDFCQIILPWMTRT